MNLNQSGDGVDNLLSINFITGSSFALFWTHWNAALVSEPQNILLPPKQRGLTFSGVSVPSLHYSICSARMANSSFHKKHFIQN